MTGIVVLLIAVLLAVAVGMWIRRREGAVRRTEVGAASAPRAQALQAVGVRPGAVTVLHFSATWCGPCAAVRRVVASAVEELDSTETPVDDVEVDMDAEPALARDFGVMSLPTTFVLDGSLRERSRASGVPSIGDLRTAIRAAAGPATS